ncbi:MAG: FliM/FliN family flagellar motor C-terminal domain-containing protein [Jannaschia sp.]
MPIDSSRSALRHMAGVPADAPAHVVAAASPVERALATALLRVADKVDGLGLALASRTSRTSLAEEAFSDLPEQGLCLMIDPPPLPDGPVPPELLAMASGALILDPAFVDALIEVQTIGRVDGPARPARKPTRIDAALTQPFVQQLVVQTAALLPRDHRGPRPGTVRTGTYLAGIGSLPMILTAPGFLNVTLEVSLGDGLRPARLSLLLPDLQGIDDAGPDVAMSVPDPDWAAAMKAAADAAPVRLDVVLPPVRMTLRDLVALKVGDLIDLEEDVLDDLQLLSGTSGLGRATRKRMPSGVVIKARLGQLNGARAIRLSSGPNDPPLEDRADRSLMAASGALSAQGPKEQRLIGGKPGGRTDIDTLHDLDALAALPELEDLPDFGPLPDLS